MSVNRRDFLKCAGLAALPALAPRMVFAAEGNASSDTVIVVFQRGGMDGLNALVPYGDSDYYRLRPTIAIAAPSPLAPAGSAIDLDGFFGLHPAAAPLKPLYDAGRLGFVHAAGLKTRNRSHFDCMDMYERGSPALGEIYDGWINRYLQQNDPKETFGAIGVGRAVQSSLRGEAPVIGLANIAGFRINSRSNRPDDLNAMLGLLYDQDSLLSNNARQALDAVVELAEARPTANAVENGATYPNTGFGNQMREVAQLIKAGVGLRVACVDIGGWDHHENIATYIGPRLDELTRTLAAFDTDLGTRMANVTVITMTEFGRRARENASRGTDHGSASVMMALGGGVVGKRVIADWPGLKDQNLYNGDLDVTIDYRSILSELIEKRMGGADLTEVFPDLQQSPHRGLFLARV
jgi:uncharacterized protein (DUF1501 family)